MSLKAIVHAHSIQLIGGDIVADLEIDTPGAFHFRTALVATNGGALTAAQAIAGLKTQVITYAASRGVTLLATEILITGGLA